MTFASKLTPEQWAEARRLRASGETYPAIARRFGVTPTAIGMRARREGWASPAGSPSSVVARQTNTGPASPVTTDIRRRLALSLFGVIGLRIKMMEQRMKKRLQAQKSRGQDGGEFVPVSSDERDTFAALIESINQVTALDPAPDHTADGLAIASDDDAFRREIAERLPKLFPPA